MQVSLREHLEAILQERELRYDQRAIAAKEALAAALIANKELTDQAFQSNREAVSQAASVLAEYKIANNEWRGTLNDWRLETIQRKEYEAERDSMRKEITDIQKWRSGIGGERDAKREDRGMAVTTVGWMIGGMALLFTLLGLVLRMFKI